MSIFLYLRLVKLLSFILGVMVLVLSVMPCADTFAYSAKGVSSFETSRDCQGNEHQDLCSPFCQCACCAGFSINTQPISLEASPVFHGENVKHASPYSASIHSISLAIWQPPQLV